MRSSSSVDSTSNKAFIGAGGLTADGVTDADSLGCSVKRAMIEQSHRTILLLDSSKYDVVQFERVCPLSDIDAFVCEAAPPKTACRRAEGRWRPA